MKATLTIQMDNAAFGDNPGQELARILNIVAIDVGQGEPLEDQTLFDYNGNTVGSLIIEEE